MKIAYLAVHLFSTTFLATKLSGSLASMIPVANSNGRSILFIFFVLITKGDGKGLLTSGGRTS
jgi:hypothetical protein